MATELPTFVLERDFDAPAELVWKALTDFDLFCRWFGPQVETVAHAFDPQVGGYAHIEMRMKNGSNYQRMDFVEVVPQERLAWLNSTTDSNWAICPNPGMPDWPRTLLTVISLSGNSGATHLKLEWTPHNASEAELAFFRGAIDALGRGWGAGMDVLEKILASLQKG
jgi:uncharacterized protein YndB with AHSA1/START domain